MKSALIILGSIVAFVVIVGAVVYAFDLRGLRSELESRTQRTGLQFLEGAIGARELRQFDFFGEKPVPLAVEGKLVEYVPEGRGFAVARGAGESWDVVSVAYGTVLASGPTPKLWLTVSPDEQYLAYAERNAAVEATSTLPATLDVYHPSAWTLHLVDIRSGAAKAVGTGSMPRLFAREGVTHLLYLRPGELRVRAIQSGNEYSLAYPIDGLWPAEVSPDGRYLALFNAERQSYDVFRFTLEDGTITLEAVPLPADELRILAFAGSHIQAVAWSSELEAAYLVDIDLENPSRAVLLSDRPGLDDVRKLFPAP